MSESQISLMTILVKTEVNLLNSYQSNRPSLRPNWNNNSNTKNIQYVQVSKSSQPSKFRIHSVPVPTHQRVGDIPTTAKRPAVPITISNIPIIAVTSKQHIPDNILFKYGVWFMDTFATSDLTTKLNTSNATARIPSWVKVIINVKKENPPHLSIIRSISVVNTTHLAKGISY